MPTWVDATYAQYFGEDGNVPGLVTETADTQATAIQATAMDATAMEATATDTMVTGATAMEGIVHDIPGGGGGDSSGVQPESMEIDDGEQPLSTEDGVVMGPSQGRANGYEDGKFTRIQLKVYRTDRS